MYQAQNLTVIHLSAFMRPFRHPSSTLCVYLVVRHQALDTAAALTSARGSRWTRPCRCTSSRPVKCTAKAARKRGHHGSSTPKEDQGQHGMTPRFKDQASEKLMLQVYLVSPW